MIPEDVKTRKGEPVIVDVDGKEFLGYIEFGDESCDLVSVACEPAGARIILRGTQIKTMRTDPDGQRPLRDKRGIKWEKKL